MQGEIIRDQSLNKVITHPSLEPSRYANHKFIYFALYYLTL